MVDEWYHEGYMAKRMEIGAVIGAAPAENVRRFVPIAGDVVILLGGRTGRDGCGGATGSPKSHDVKSIETSGAEVQKGNAPEERKLQRLFRMPEAARMIKRCNDFGAGGVCVAIGELVDGLDIDLDSVPKALPALMRAQKLQKRAARFGCGPENAAGAARALDSARAAWDAQQTAENAGELLLAAADAMRLAGVDAEEALTFAAKRFTQRLEADET